MSRFDRRLQEHPVFAELEGLRAAVDGISEETLAAMEEAGVDGATERARLLVDVAVGHLTAAEPLLITQGKLDGLFAAVQQARTSALALNEDPGQGAAFDASLDAIADATLALTGVLPVQADAAKVIAEELAPAVAGRVRDLAAELEDLTQHLAELQQEGQREAAQISEADEMRRQELSSSIEALREQVDTLNSQVTTMVSEHQGQFSQAQEGYRREFSELITQIKTEGQDAVSAVQAEGSAAQTKWSEDAERQLSEGKEAADAALLEIEEILAKVDELYQVIGQKGTAGAFHDDAEQQKKAADQWRLGAVGFGVTAALVAVGAVVGAWFDLGLSAAAITAKVTATAAFAGLAAYAAKQSGHHRHREERERRLELELVAFEPFIRALEEGEQREARKAFLERFFTGQAGAPDSNADAHTFSAIQPPVP